MQKRRKLEVYELGGSDWYGQVYEEQNGRYAWVLGVGFGLLTGTLAQARVEIVASDLLLKNSEQYSAIVRKKIKKAQDIQAKQEIEVNDKGEIFAEPEAVASLRDAMRIVLSRPDQDGARS